ncbi:hypothetical protein ACQ4M4_07890 [Leptolyngbya sp. AN02str]|uniref:hypothetical protein n=1 Tax=Leptolyngbya sp. AN02str TaxID=3423363 RepID=UPI003D31982F
MFPPLRDALSDVSPHAIAPISQAPIVPVSRHLELPAPTVEVMAPLPTTPTEIVLAPPLPKSIAKAPPIVVKARPIKPKARPLRLKANASATAKADTTQIGSVRPFPAAQQTPTWLKKLLMAQAISNPLTLVLVIAAGMVYAGTVYTQQMWSRSYSRLESLQSQERQIIAADESLKHQMAQQAAKANSGLTLPTTDHTIFLPAPLPLPAASMQAPQPTLPTPQNPASRPLGY